MLTSLRRFSMLSILGTFAIVLCVTGAAFYQLYTQRMEEERIVGVQMAHQASQAMSLWLDDQVSIVRTIAQAPALSQACATPQDAEARQKASDLLHVFHAHHAAYTLMGFISYKIPPEGLVISNAKGKDIRVQSGQSLGDSRGNVSLGIGGMDFNYISAIYQGSTAFISEAKVNAVPGLPPVFVLAAPIHGPDGLLAGCLFASITLESFSQDFSRAARVRGSASMEIVDERGRYVAHDVSSRILSPEYPPAPALLHALENSDRHFSVTDEDGHTQLYSAVEVFPSHQSADRWWILFRRELREVLSDLHAPLLSLGLLFVLLFVLVAYLIRKMGQQMHRVLEAQTLQTELDMHRQLKQALHRERTTLRNIIDNIQGIIFMRDAHDRYVLINSQFTTILGMTQEDVEGKTDDELLPPDLAAFCRNTDAAARQTKGPYYFEQTLTTLGGNARDYLFSKEIVYDSEGRCHGVLGVGIDVTLLKKTQRELTQAKAKAEEASMAKSAFLSTVSHEIRTPMNAIVGFAHLFGRTPLNDTQRDYLKKIHEASTSLLSIINNVLDLSKIESGRLELEHVTFRLEALLLAVTSMAENAAHPKGIGFVLRIAPNTPPYLKGDPTRVQQILLNLVNNAVKFTDKGVVRLDVSPEATIPPRSDSSAALPMPPLGAHSDAAPNQPARMLIGFRVTDTGIGMSHEQQQRIFEPFTQADASTTRKYGGTGLGLSICRELVDIMGGNISLQSTQGQGTSFHVVLPLEISCEADAQPVPSVVDTPLHSDGPPFAGFNVLLVEDNCINQEIARALLETLGLSVDVAEDGVQAVRMAQARSYDLIFMDIQMPNMDGLECTRRLRALGAVQEPDAAHGRDVGWLRTVPIVAMTANAMQEDKNACLAAGMDGHLGKPLDPLALRDVLCHWLRQA